jgi:integrase/recombinase XerC
MDLKLASNIFLENLINQKNFSPKTKQTYEYALANFAEYFLEEYQVVPEIEQIDFEDLRPFLGWLQDRGFQRNSIRLKTSAIKSLFKFLFVEEYIEKNIASSLSTPKRAKRLPNFLTENEVDNLLNQFNENNPDQLLSKLLIQTIYGSGLRISEALNLKYLDINFAYNTFKILGKGGKERITPFGEHTKTIIQKYSNSTRNNKPVSYLFTKPDGKRLPYSQAYQIVHRAMMGITETKQKSPHTLRHTFATHLVNNGADIRSVGEMLGHSSLSSTQIYTHFSIDKIKEIYKNAHPKS